MIDKAELRALLRIIVAGKFYGYIQDPEIPASPVVANIANKVAEAVDALDVEELHGENLALVRRWRRIDPAREEWKVITEYVILRIGKQWLDWEQEKRSGVIENLFSPFFISQEQSDAFDREVSDRLWGKSGSGL